MRVFCFGCLSTSCIPYCSVFCFAYLLKKKNRCVPSLLSIKEMDWSPTTYFMDFKRIYEELNMLLPFSLDVKVQQAQWE